MRAYKAFVCGIVAVAGLAWSAFASAFAIAIVPAESTHAQGAAFDLDVVVTDLEAQGEVLSGFNFNVQYDAGLLTLLGVTEGPALVPSLFLNTPVSAGIEELFAVSFASDAALAAQQGNSLVIATLTFRGLGPGIASLSLGPFAPGSLSGSFDTATQQARDLTLLNPTISGARVIITPALVPEPSTLLLASLALIALGLSGGRRPH